VAHEEPVETVCGNGESRGGSARSLSDSWWASVSGWPRRATSRRLRHGPRPGIPARGDRQACLDAVRIRVRLFPQPPWGSVRRIPRGHRTYVTSSGSGGASGVSGRGIARRSRSLWTTLTFCAAAIKRFTSAGGEQFDGPGDALPTQPAIPGQLRLRSWL